MGVTCLVVFAIGAVAYCGSVNAQTGDRGAASREGLVTLIESGAARCRSRPNFRQGGNDDCYPVRLRASAQEESICVHFA
jgi:hypothetical protein